MSAIPILSPDDAMFSRCFWPSYPCNKTYLPSNRQQLQSVLKYAWEALQCFFMRCKYACFDFAKTRRIHWFTNEKLRQKFLFRAEKLSPADLESLRKSPSPIVQICESRLQEIHVQKVLAGEIEFVAESYKLSGEHYMTKVIDVELPSPPLEYQGKALWQKWEQLWKEADMRNTSVIDDGTAVSYEKLQERWTDRLSFLCSLKPVIADAYGKKNESDARKAAILLGHLAYHLQKPGISQTEKRGVIEAVLIAFGHCTDRILSDLEDVGYRYLSNLFNPEQHSLQQRLLLGLQRLRMQIFGEACRLQYDSHYASTYRYMLGYFQEQFGLKQLFTTSSYYEASAARERYLEVQDRFLAEYQLTRIASGLARIWMQVVQDKDDCLYRVSYDLAFQWFKEEYQKECALYKKVPTEDEINIETAKLVWLDDDVGQRVNAAAIFRFLEGMGVCTSIDAKKPLPIFSPPPASSLPVKIPLGRRIRSLFS